MQSIIKIQKEEIRKLINNIEFVVCYKHTTNEKVMHLGNWKNSTFFYQFFICITFNGLDPLTTQCLNKYRCKCITEEDLKIFFDDKEATAMCYDELFKDKNTINTINNSVDMKKKIIELFEKEVIWILEENFNKFTEEMKFNIQFPSTFAFNFDDIGPISIKTLCDNKEVPVDHSLTNQEVAKNIEICKIIPFFSSFSNSETQIFISKITSTKTIKLHSSNNQKKEIDGHYLWTQFPKTQKRLETHPKFIFDNFQFLFILHSSKYLVIQ